MTSHEPHTLHVCLPPGLAAIVERAVATGDFVDPAEFVRYLVRAYQASLEDRERVERLLAVEDDAHELALGLDGR